MQIRLVVNLDIDTEEPHAAIVAALIELCKTLGEGWQEVEHWDGRVIGEATLSFTENPE